MSENNYAIEFKGASKIYKLKKKGQKTRRFYALKKLSFCIEKGTVVGILGTNGSGKSTLSTMLAGISTPDEGEVIVNGEAALVAINSGLNRQLTGLENIELKGAMMGLSRKKIKEITEGVIEFAELGEFLYQPVKNYSAGMKSRLGFTMNLYLDPDIIIVDEALTVGDTAFAYKCTDHMTKLKGSGKTILFISHVLIQVRRFCDYCLWIEGGQLVEFGPCQEVCDHYQEYTKKLGALTPAEKAKVMKEKFQARLID